MSSNDAAVVNSRTEVGDRQSLIPVGGVVGMVPMILKKLVGLGNALSADVIILTVRTRTFAL